MLTKSFEHGHYQINALYMSCSPGLSRRLLQEIHIHALEIVSISSDKFDHFDQLPINLNKIIIEKLQIR